MKKGALLGVSLAAALVSGAASAEVLEITGEFAAPDREASMLRSLSVGRIAGQDGMALRNAIERALAGSQLDLLGGRTGRDAAEGSLSGAISTGVEETGFTKKEKKCVEKDKNGKCIKEQEVEVRCRRRAVNVNADLRIVRNTDGRIVYSREKPFRNEISWCQGQRPYTSVEDTVANAIRDMAGSVRADITPSVQTYRIRVRESSKGMPKDLGKRFKELIKLTKRDPRGACQGWEAMSAEAPGHPSLTFDRGLCAEQRGDYERALQLYREAARAGAGEGNDGADRAMRLIAGREDAEERARRGG